MNQIQILVALEQQTKTEKVVVEPTHLKQHMRKSKWVHLPPIFRVKHKQMKFHHLEFHQPWENVPPSFDVKIVKPSISLKLPSLKEFATFLDPANNQFKVDGKW